MERSEQIERIGKKICLIMGMDKNVGPALHHHYEGGGKVATLVLRASHGNKDLVDEASKILTDVLMLKLKDEQRNHGKGQIYTLIVPLSSVSEESLEKINSLTQEIIKKENSNGKVVRPEKPKKVEPCEKEVAEQATLIPAVAHKREMSDASKYRLSLSRYLRPIMEMEGVIPSQFPFDPIVNGGMITIQCQNGEIAYMIEKSIAYTSKEVVMRDGLLLMVDGSKFYGLEHKPFAFPPKEGQSLEDVKEKIQSLCSSRFSLSKDGKRLLISFSRETAAHRAYKLFGDLHWNMVGIHSDGKHIVFKCGYAEEKKSTIPFAPAPVSSINYASHTPYVSGLPSPNKSIVPSSNDIINELKSMLAVGNLSPETMERIEKALLDDLKRSNPEEYAKILLAKLGY